MAGRDRERVLNILGGLLCDVRVSVHICPQMGKSGKQC